MSVTHFHAVSSNVCKQIHWCKNTGLGDEFAIELTNLDQTKACPFDYSEYIYLLTMFEV